MTKKNTNKRASKRAAMPSGRDVAVIVRAMRPSTLEKLQRRVDFMRGDMRDVIEEVERVQFLTRVRRGTTSALEKAISMTVHEALMAAANALEDADAALENLDAEIGDAMAERRTRQRSTGR